MSRGEERGERKNNGRGAVLTGGSCLFGQPGCNVGGRRREKGSDVGVGYNGLHPTFSLFSFCVRCLSVCVCFFACLHAERGPLVQF